MLNNHKNNLKVALPGMDGRTQKTLAMFLQGPCKSANVLVVGEDDSELDIIDIDLPAGKNILDKISVNGPTHPTVVISIKEYVFNDSQMILYLKKPIEREEMLSILDKAKALIRGKNRSKNTKHEKNQLDQNSLLTLIEPEKNENGCAVNLNRLSTELSERNKSSKHRTAMQMDEKGFATYMGISSTLDISRPAELKGAFYDPRDYFQGYVQSAFKVATAKGHILQLNSGWKQLLIFPHSHEIWLDADDKQLRSFAGIMINKGSAKHRKMSVKPINPESIINNDLDKFQSMDSLIWKLACWTSKGRYPQQLDINQPVYLKHWPNFTRLLVPPHAIRIAALLIEKPRTPVNIAEVLKIRPEYVFIFISASFSVGLLGQAIRNADIVVAPEKVNPNRKNNLFSRIIHKLRAN